MDDGLAFSADEMVAWFGRQAAAVAARRAEDLARRGEWRAADRALLLLTRLERRERETEAGRA